MFTSIVSVSAFSQNTLTVFQKDGQEFSFGFDEKPVITYTDNDMIIKTTNTEVQYQLLNLQKVAFTDGPTAVNSIDADKSKIVLESYSVKIAGAEAGVEVTMSGVDGKTAGSYKTDSDGCVTFSIAELPEGIYLIKSENMSFKILKK